MFIFSFAADNCGSHDRSCVSVLSIDSDPEPVSIGCLDPLHLILMKVYVLSSSDNDSSQNAFA